MDVIAKRGLTLTQAAARAGYSSGAYLSGIIRRGGEGYFPPSQAFRLSAAFGLNPGYLISGEGEALLVCVPPVDGRAPAGVVLAELFGDMMRHGISLGEAARILGYESRQSLYAIRYAGHYLSPVVAERFVRAFGYSQGYLCGGIGSLRGAAAVRRGDANVRDLLDVIARQDDEIRALKQENERLHTAAGNAS